MEAALSAAPDQTDLFRTRFTRLIELVLSGSFDDPDVRRVMELVTVSVDSED